MKERQEAQSVEHGTLVVGILDSNPARDIDLVVGSDPTYPALSEERYGLNNNYSDSCVSG